MIIIDIWGGDLSQVLVARFLREAIDDALDVVRSNVDRGFLVNIRKEDDCSGYTEFDNSKPLSQPLN